MSIQVHNNDLIRDPALSSSPATHQILGWSLHSNADHLRVINPLTDHKPEELDAC